MNESVAADELRMVKELLWHAVESRVAPAEREEVRRVLGERVLEENEQIYAEAGALAEIIGEVRAHCLICWLCFSYR